MLRVIVIGSGIAGLSAAVALRKVGIEVALYERAPELREVGAGISLWANALRASSWWALLPSVPAVSHDATDSSSAYCSGIVTGSVMGREQTSKSGRKQFL